jgi:hypothetical protein
MVMMRRCYDVMMVYNGVEVVSAMKTNVTNTDVTLRS